MALFTKLPSWASILITVIAAVIVVGLVSWGTYTLVKPGPEKLPEGEEAVEEGEELPEEEDETANWKTYRNEKYGFEIKIPTDLVAEQYNGEIHFMTLQAKKAREENIKNCSDNNPETICEPEMMNSRLRFIDGFKYGEEKNKINTETEIINGITWENFQLLGDLYPSIYFETKNNTKIYNFASAYFDEKQMQNILSTFKFIETKETANWKTYRNDEYGFEIKYPSEDWAVRYESDTHVMIGRFPADFPHITAFTITIDERNLDDYIVDYNRSSASSGTESIEKIGDFILGELNATRLKASTALGIDKHLVFTRKNNKSYIIEYIPSSSIHDQMLSTFRFAE